MTETPAQTGDEQLRNCTSGLQWCKSDATLSNFQPFSIISGSSLLMGNLAGSVEAMGDGLLRNGIPLVLVEI